MRITNEEIYDEYKSGISGVFSLMIDNRITYKRICSALRKVGGKEFPLPKNPTKELERLYIFLNKELN